MTNLSIGFLGARGKQTSYRITGQDGEDGVDVAEISSLFNRVIQNTQIPGIEPVTSDPGSLHSTGNSIKTSIETNGVDFPFEISDSVLMVYETESQRDALLSQLLDLFRNIHVGTNNLRISLIREKSGPSTAKQVFFKISGESKRKIDPAQTRRAFQQVLNNSNLKDISAVFAGNSTLKTKDHVYSFEITDSLLLTNVSATPRNVSEENILNIWRSALAKYLVDGPQLRVIGEGPSATAGDTKILTYRLTGVSEEPVDSAEAVRLFYKELQRSPVDGILRASAKIPIQFDPSLDVSGVRGKPFEVNEKIFLSWNSTEERDLLLQKLVSLFQETFGAFQGLSNLRINFFGEPNASANPHKIFFRIMGNNGSTSSLKNALAAFQKNITLAHIVGVDGDTNNTLPLLPVSEVKLALNNSRVTVHRDFKIVSSVNLTYGNVEERDKFLQEILSMWRKALEPYQVSNVTINLLEERGGKGKKSLQYAVSGQSANPIDSEAAKRMFQTALRGSHLSTAQ